MMRTPLRLHELHYARSNVSGCFLFYTYGKTFLRKNQKNVLLLQEFCVIINVCLSLFIKATHIFDKFKLLQTDDFMAIHGVRRNLNTQIAADDFLESVLTDFDDDNGELAAQIVSAELGLFALEDQPTLTHKDYRVAKYRSKKDRDKLNDQILKELISLQRLEDDDKICLGVGGAKPEFIKSEAHAYIVSGAPASGKSGIAGALANKAGAYILDSDYAKRKFYEYHFYYGGASLVHKESDQIIFGGNKNLFEYCVYSRHNIVIPLVGRTYESLEEICQKLIDADYSIHIVNVVLDRVKCVSRAIHRYKATKRYVPLSYIFDEVGNQPEIVYYRLKREYSDHKSFKGFTQYSTDVPEGNKPELVESTEDVSLLI